MATAQGFIQPFAQANTPSSVNNGNPATVYNTPQTGAQRPLQGWTIDQPAAANLNLSNTASGAVQQANDLIQNNGWVAPQQTNTVQTPQLTVPDGWMGGVATPTPTPPTTTTPPTTNQPDTSSWQWVVMNGRVPGMNQQLYNSDPNYKRAWDQAVAEHNSQFNKSYNKDSNAQVIEQRLKDLYSQFSSGSAPVGTGTAGGNAGGWVSGGGGGQTAGSNATQQWVNNLASGGVPVVNMNRGWASSTGGDASKMSNALSSITDRFTSMGGKFDSGSAMQFLDAITEPFLPGNLYLSELGQVNSQEVLKSIMNHAVPGLGSLAQRLAASIPDSVGGLLGKIRDWVKDGQFNELANEVYKGVRKDSENKVNKGGLDASQTTGGGGGSSVGGGGMGTGWLYLPGGSVNPNNYMPKIDVGEVRTA